MLFPEHLEDKPPTTGLISVPIKIRMRGSEEVSEDIIFDLYLSEASGCFVAKNGDLSFYIATQEIDRLMGTKMPQWELVL